MSLRGNEPVAGADDPLAYTLCAEAHGADCTDRLVYVHGCACPGHEEARQMAVLTTGDLGAAVGARAWPVP